MHLAAALLLGLHRAGGHVGLERGGEPLRLALPDGARLFYLCVWVIVLGVKWCQLVMVLGVQVSVGVGVGVGG